MSASQAEGRGFKSRFPLQNFQAFRLSPKGFFFFQARYRDLVSRLSPELSGTIHSAMKTPAIMARNDTPQSFKPQSCLKQNPSTGPHRRNGFHLRDGSPVVSLGAGFPATMRRRIPADPKCAASQGVGKIHTVLWTLRARESGPLPHRKRLLSLSGRPAPHVIPLPLVRKGRYPSFSPQRLIRPI